MPEIHGVKRGPEVIVWVDDGPVRIYGYGNTRQAALSDLRKSLELDLTLPIYLGRRESSQNILVWMNEKGY